MPKKKVGQNKPRGAKNRIGSLGRATRGESNAGDPMSSNKCFVLMPFSEPFDNYYKKILVPAINAAGLHPVRADEIYSTGPIIRDVIEGIRSSVALVADVTGKNANVNYELGMAHIL